MSRAKSRDRGRERRWKTNLGRYTERWNSAPASSAVPKALWAGNQADTIGSEPGVFLHSGEGYLEAHIHSKAFPWYRRSELNRGMRAWLGRL